MFILAEYCCSHFYHGWHLYERNRNDGSRNDDPWDWWGWLRGELQQRHVRDLCVEIGYDAPAVTRHGQELAEWFAATFPNGLEVEVTCHTYRLVAIVAKRPRSRRRHVVRTIRGAAMAQRRFDSLSDE